MLIRLRVADLAAALRDGLFEQPVSMSILPRGIQESHVFKVSPYVSNNLLVREQQGVYRSSTSMEGVGNNGVKYGIFLHNIAFLASHDCEHRAWNLRGIAHSRTARTVWYSRCPHDS